MREKGIDVPPAWQNIDFLQLRGILLVVGKPDVGKSTFCRYLYHRLCSVSPCVAYLDGDPGQSILGPPCTMTLALAAEGDPSFPPSGKIWRSFVGSVSPRGHMLQILTGAARLTRAARDAGMQALIYDTTGLIHPAGGGVNLKLAKIDLLRPTFLFAIQANHLDLHAKGGRDSAGRYGFGLAEFRRSVFKVTLTPFCGRG